MSFKDSLDVLTMGPREWRPLLTVPGLARVEALYWAHYLARFAPLDVWLQTRGSKRPREDFRFGETPWFTGLELLELAGVGPADVLYDLGAGRGKMVFLAALARGCRAVGLELLEGYNYVSRRIARLSRIQERVEFRCEDFLRADLSPATVAYLAGTTWSESTFQGACNRLEDLQAGARVLSVSRKIERPHLSQVAEQRHLFSWGRERVWLYERVSGCPKSPPA